MIVDINSFLLLIYIFVFSVCASETKIQNDSANVIQYNGEKFPEQYLYAEDVAPTKLDLYKYIAALDKVFTYFNSEANDTCHNRAIGSFLAKVTLIRTLKDDGERLEKPQLDMLKSLIHKIDYYLSHFMYKHIVGIPFLLNEHWIKLKEFALALRGQEVLASSMPDFSRNQLKNWILTNDNVNKFVEDMDTLNLPKEKYVKILTRSASPKYKYHVTAQVSDHCIINLETNILPPTNSETLKTCRPDAKCKKGIHSRPSIAYGLSHRMLNFMLYRYQRHCFWTSPEADLHQLNHLCAFMYREAVYLARRGYFARDMFLEHVALCGMMGYEEFFRRNWFYHAMRWLDVNGCFTENRNLHLNRTRIELQQLDKSRHWHIKLQLKDSLRTNCEDHPMAVLTPFLANAIRHAAHFFSH